MKTAYLYSIKVSKDELNKFMKYHCNDKRVDYPYILNLSNKEKILILHGSEDGKYYENEQFPIDYTKTVMNMYKNFFWDTPSKTIFTVSCYGGCQITLYDPLDISIEPVFKSKDELKIRYNLDMNCIEIMCYNKVEIPKPLQKVIKFEKKIKED